MDSPNARQNRIAYDSTLTREPAFPHGSSSEVRDGHDSPPTSVQVEERRGLSGLSVELRGVAALPEGFPEDASHGSNVRVGTSAGVSHTAEDLAQLPHEAEQLARLLQQARATQYAGLLAELGAVNAEDLSIMAAAELAPMPIIRAKQLIRCAAAAVADCGRMVACMVCGESRSQSGVDNKETCVCWPNVVDRPSSIAPFPASRLSATRLCRWPTRAGQWRESRVRCVCACVCVCVYVCACE